MPTCIQTANQSYSRYLLCVCLSVVICQQGHIFSGKERKPDNDGVKSVIKTAKGKFLLYIITAILFVIASFSYIDITENENSFFGSTFFYFLMIIAVFNAGLYTQKYIESKKDDD